MELEPLETLSPERIDYLERYALFIYEFAQQERVNELRTVDVGRFKDKLNTDLGNYIEGVVKKLVEQGKLEKGTRGGYSLT